MNKCNKTANIAALRSEDVFERVYERVPQQANAYVCSFGYNLYFEIRHRLINSFHGRTLTDAVT